MQKIRLFAILLSAVALGACADVQPRILAFDYDVAPLTQRTQDAIVASVSNGTLTVADVMPTNPCTFIADFSAGRTNTTFNGDPGQSGFNIELRSVNANNTATANRPDCPTVESFEFLAGDQNLPWGPGESVIRTGFSTTVGGEDFTSRYFRARMHSAPSNNYVTGEFEFVGKTSSGLTILGTGPFSLKD